jgi:uncharacterized protein YbjT (DUF2867 family)
MHDVSTGNSAAAVAVVGAAGHTGRFVVDELRRRGLAPVAVTRAGVPVAGILASAWRAADLHDPASLDRALSGARTVIHCAGPFLDTAGPVARAALRAGAHYLDVTAEQASARETLEALDAAARAADLVVIPAMGFYGGFADLLVTAAASGWSQADTIEVLIGLDRWHPTPGTRRTGARNTVPRVVVSGGRLAPLPRPAAERTWLFGPPLGRQALVEVPFSETILVHRHLPSAELHTYLSQVALADLRDEATPVPAPVDARGRSAQRFEVQAVVRQDGEIRRATARGQDIYAFTAPLVVEVAHRLLAGRFAAAGAHAPGAILDARGVLAALAPEHLELAFSGPKDGGPSGQLLGAQVGRG